MLDHEVEIRADRYLPLTADLLPTGELAPVAGTPMDFTDSAAIGERHPRAGTPSSSSPGATTTTTSWTGRARRRGTCCWPPVSASRAAAGCWRSGPPSRGSTSTPATSSTVARGHRAARSYRQGDAFALEPEHFSNSPNMPQFPTTVLRPGETYASATEYRFLPNAPAALAPGVVTSRTAPAGHEIRRLDVRMSRAPLSP